MPSGILGTAPPPPAIRTSWPPYCAALSDPASLLPPRDSHGRTSAAHLLAGPRAPARGPPIRLVEPPPRAPGSLRPAARRGLRPGPAPGEQGRGCRREARRQLPPPAAGTPPALAGAAPALAPPAPRRRMGSRIGEGGRGEGPLAPSELREEGRPSPAPLRGESRAAPPPASRAAPPLPPSAWTKSDATVWTSKHESVFPSCFDFIFQFYLHPNNGFGIVT